MFLQQLDLRHNISLPPQRQEDQLLMRAFASLPLSIDQMCSLNRCRLFLHAYWLSDIVDGYGRHITDDAWLDAWLGRSTQPEKATSWPRQGHPSQADWIQWRQAISLCFILRGRRLKHPLGYWLTTSSNQWYFNPSDNSLYQHSNLVTLRYPMVPWPSGRPCFSRQGCPSALPPNLPKAVLYRQGEYLCLNVYAACLQNNNTDHSSFRS